MGYKRIKKLLNNKIILFILIGIIFVIFPVFSAFADEKAGSNSLGIDIEEILDEQIQASGVEKLFDELPSETEVYMQELGIDEINISNILSLNTNEFFKLILKIIQDYFREVGSIFIAIIGIIMISVFMDVLKGHFSDSSLANVFNLVSVLCLISIVVVPIISTLSKVINAIEAESAFITSLIPVLGGIMAVGGQPVTGATYHMVLYGVAQVISAIMYTVVVPLVNIYIALCLASSVSPKLNLENAAKGLKNIATWVMGLTVTIFVALLATQTIVTSSADSLTSKAGKFLIGNAIPVVGGALSDAVTTIYGCLGLLKNVVGVFGVVSAILIILPILIECLVWVFMLNVTALISDIFSVKIISDLLRSVSSAVTLLCSILISTGFLLIVSTSIVLVIGGNGS